MIQNPQLEAFKYDPYNKIITRERYDHQDMQTMRKDAISATKDAKKWGIVLGTLGRQGSTRILDHLTRRMTQLGKQYMVVLLSEIFPAKLAQMSDIDA